MAMKQRYPDFRRKGIVVSVSTFKGGAAKTTSTGGFVVKLTKEGYRVLAVDMDPQGNLTSRLGMLPGMFSGHAGMGLHDLFQNDWDPERMKAQVCSMKVDGQTNPIDLIPSSDKIERIMGELNSPPIVNSARMRLAKALDGLRPYYDYIILDTPPGRENLSVDMCLNAADVVLIPVDGFDSLYGMVDFLRRVETTGLQPEVFIYSASCARERLAKPVGVAGVRNNTWYPLLLQAFPQHFIPYVVPRTNAVQGTTHPGLMWMGMPPGPRREYTQLYEALFHESIGNSSIPKLPALLAQGDINLDQVENLIRRQQRRVFRDVELHNLTFMRNPRAPRRKRA